MQARPRPSLDTNVSQYASHALHLHSADSGPSSSTAPCDSAGSSLVDPFASPREDSRTADLASSVHEQASPTLAHQRSRSHSVTSQGCTISKNGVVYQEYYIAKYDYEPESPNYLPFSAGQLIKIIRKHSSGWWDGELAGRRGWFPSNYLYSDSSRLVRVRSNSLESTRTSVHSTNSNHSHARSGSNTSDEDDWMNVSLNDFLALQSDLSMRQPRDVPADMPYMVVMDRALCMVEVAALKKSLDHLAPFTACVIGIVRAVLSSAQCLSRDAPNLQRFPELQKARKAVLGELARLVGQTKKVGGEMEGEVELTHDEYQEELEKTMKISLTLFNNVQLFVVLCLDRSIHIQEAPRKLGLLDVGDEPDVEARTASAATGQSVPRNASLKRSLGVGPRTTSLAALRGAKSVGDLRGGQVGTARNSVTDPIKTARRARVIHGRGARSQSQSSTLGFPDMDAQGRTGESSSSLSSLESSPFTPEAIVFPCGACKSTLVLAALRTVLDSLLGVTAAFIGHAQLHSRTSHPASKGTLIALTRQLVELVRKLLTIVEAVVQHEAITREKQREVLLLSQYKDALYTSTNIAVDGVRELTNQPPTPSETEDQERAAVVAAVTDTLKLCAECGNAVRLCLSRKMGEETLVIWIPRLPGSPEPTPTSATEPGLLNVTIGSNEQAPAPKGELRQRAKTTGGLRTQFVRDGEAVSPSEGTDKLVAEEAMGEAWSHTLQRGHAKVVTAESTSGRPRGDSGSSASTDATKLFEDEGNHHSRASSARTSGEPRALVDTQVDQPDETDAVLSTMADWNGFGGQESIPPTPLTPILDEKQQIPMPSRMQEERLPPVQPYPQRGDLILDPQGNILAATFEALVERLTHPDERPDLQLMTHFLLTFRVFATPIQLADTLIERWTRRPPPEESRPVNFNPRLWDTQTLSIRARVVNFITEWTKIHWYPPTDIAAVPKLLEFMKGETSDAARRLVSLLHRVNAPSPGRRGPSMEATRNKAERMNMLTAFVQNMDPSATLSPTVVTAEVPRPSMTKSLLNNLRAKAFLPIHPLDFDPVEMARQLTIMENQVYSQIPMQEMIEKVDGRSVPHVKAVSNLSNAITGWITSHVLKEVLDVKKRVAVIKFFLKVFRECIRMHNHATPVAILGALDSTPIRRLTLVWALLTPKYQEIRKEMQGMLNRDNNFSTYRRLLNSAKPPAVPFLGRYLGDVHFALEVTPTRPSLTDPTVTFINWRRYSQLGKILGDVCRFQQPFNLKEFPEVQEYLAWAFELSGALQDADELQRLSLLIQPRERNDPRQNSRAPDILGFARDLKLARTASAVEQA